MSCKWLDDSPEQLNEAARLRSNLIWNVLLRTGLNGAMVPRLTPDQKVACSNHVGVTIL